MKTLIDIFSPFARFKRFKSLKSKYDDSKLKEIVVKVLSRFMFFSEEDELVQDDDEETAQKEIMDSHSSVIAETIRKVIMCHVELNKSDT